jgi:hypothetical protein
MPRVGITSYKPDLSVLILSEAMSPLRYSDEPAERN